MSQVFIKQKILPQASFGRKFFWGILGLLLFIFQWLMLWNIDAFFAVSCENLQRKFSVVRTLFTGVEQA